MRLANPLLAKINLISSDQPNILNTHKVTLLILKFTLQIRNAAGQISHYVDGRDPKTSNWMRYIVIDDTKLDFPFCKFFCDK